MHQTELGNTGLMVSRAGLGGGGNSRLGLGRGATHDECVELVREAIDLGVNFIDTAQNYQTESIVGDAISGPTRDHVVVSTKTLVRNNEQLLTPQQIEQSIEQSLRQLKTDYIDVFHLHAVLPDFYEYVLQDIAPVLVKAKEAGKIRHIGITESSPRDLEQIMLHRAIRDEPWEVIMLGFNLMNQGARREVLPVALERGIGTMIMFAVRNVFSRPDVLRATMRGLARDGSLDAKIGASEDPLGFLVHELGADSLTDAAYRYVLHQPGVDVVLFGTGSIDHLRSNIASLSKPALPAADVDELHRLFGHLTGVGLDMPDRKQAKSTPK